MNEPLPKYIKLLDNYHIFIEPTIREDFRYALESDMQYIDYMVVIIDNNAGSVITISHTVPTYYFTKYKKRIAKNAFKLAKHLIINKATKKNISGLLKKLPRRIFDCELIDDFKDRNTINFYFNFYNKQAKENFIFIVI